MWRIGDGKSVSFWFDHWLGDGPLFLKDGIKIDDEQIQIKVGDIIDSNRNWNLNFLKYPLPEDISRLMLGYQLGSNPNAKDALVWSGSKDGQITAKGAYYFLTENTQMENQSTKWNWIWKLPCSQRIRMFIWTCFHNRVMVNNERARREFTNNPFCDK